MSKRAARINDSTDCPGYISDGSSNVFINNKKSARINDTVYCSCPGANGKIISGSATVFINNKKAARIGDNVFCPTNQNCPNSSCKINDGSNDVLIGG